MVSWRLKPDAHPEALFPVRIVQGVSAGDRDLRAPGETKAKNEQDEFHVK